MSTKEERLAALQEAAQTWYNKRIKAIDDQLAFSRRVLQGRPGAEHLAGGTVESATEMLWEEIDELLSFQ